MARNFIIRPPKWIRNYSFWIMVFSALGVIVFSVLYFKKTVVLNVALTLGIVCTVFFVAAIFGMIIYNSDRFYFENGTYFLKKPFKKLKSVDCMLVSHVDIKQKDNAFSSVEVTFFDKNDCVLLTFLADGWIFKKNVFLTSLRQNRIKVNKDFNVL